MNAYPSAPFRGAPAKRTLIGLLFSALVAAGAAGCAHDNVSWSQRVDDTTITSKVKAALLGDPDVSGMAISVETLRGDVQLSGFVDSAAKARRAVDLAERVEGVDEVINKMTVKSN
jgi:hyperosmotically inducible periplasmic protein